MEEIYFYNKIKVLINVEFPLLNINIYRDHNDVVVSINNKDVYNSELYQELVSKINMELLWPENIMNVIFVFNNDEIYKAKFNRSINFGTLDVSTKWNYGKDNYDLSSYDKNISDELQVAA